MTVELDSQREEPSGAQGMTGELQRITLTIEIEPTALAFLQQQADKQG